MQHSLRAVCADCGVEMKPYKNGLMLEARLKDGRPYYKVSSDKWICPCCGWTAYIGFAPEAIPSTDAERYDRIFPDATITLK